MPGSEPLESEPLELEPLELEPVPDDGIGAIRVGLVLWALVGVVLLVRRADLADRGTEWWLLACLAGVVIGFVEWGVFARRAANHRAREAAAEAAAGAPAAEPAGGPADPAIRDQDATGPTA